MDLGRRYESLLFVSPHFDDAALSCAGLALSRPDLPKTCLTLFGGADRRGELSHVAEMILRAMGGRSLAETMEMRRQEDDAAASALDWAAERLTYAEGPFRHPAYGVSPLAVFGDVASEEDALVQALSDELHARTTEKTLVVAPLAVGHHVDHVIALRAASSLKERHRTVVFYEDYPYADGARAPALVRLARRARLGAPFEDHEVWAALDPSTARRAEGTDLVAEHMRDLGLDGTATFVPVEAALDRKATAVRAYSSQLAEIFDESSVRDVLRAFHSRPHLGASEPSERYWTLTRSPA